MKIQPRIYNPHYNYSFICFDHLEDTLLSVDRIYVSCSPTIIISDVFVELTNLFKEKGSFFDVYNLFRLPENIEQSTHTDVVVCDDLLLSEFPDALKNTVNQRPDAFEVLNSDNWVFLRYSQIGSFSSQSKPLTCRYLSSQFFTEGCVSTLDNMWDNVKYRQRLMGASIDFCLSNHALDSKPSVGDDLVFVV